jgi:hypothetical protein
MYVWVADPPLSVWLVPSPKLHTTLLIADEGVAIAVNVIGDPAAATLVDVATDTDSAVGLVVR